MNISIKNIGIDEITDTLLGQLQVLFDGSYFDSHMYKDFCSDMKENHNFFRVFLAYNEEKIVGIGVLEDKLNTNKEHFGYQPVYLKRFTVDIDHRGNHIGKMILDEIKNYAKYTYKIPVIFGESNELGAIAFYLREGAQFHISSIENYSSRNTVQENIVFFKEFVTNKVFKKYRYPVGGGIPFVYVLDKSIEDEFHQKKFISRDDIFNIKP